MILKYTISLMHVQVLFHSLLVTVPCTSHGPGYLCCDGVRRDTATACCGGQVTYSRHHACCGGRSYDIRRKFCCSDGLRTKHFDFMDACCGSPSILYSSTDHVCCDGHIQFKFKFMATRMLINDKCCGTVAYPSFNSVCCEGRVSFGTMCHP